MDVSKLPRLSKTEAGGSTEGAPPGQTPQPQVNPPAQAIQPLQAPVGAAPGIGIEIWITIIVGLLFLALGRGFARYEVARIKHQPYHTGILWQEGPLSGTEVPYPQLDASFGLPYYSDSGLFVFGVALILGALAQLLWLTRLPGKMLVAWIALLAVAAATIYNLFVCAKLFGADITPILSLLCVALGGYEVYVAWRLITPPRVNPPAPGSP